MRKAISLLVILAGMATADASLLSFSQEDLENNKLATAQSILSDDHLHFGQQYRIMTAEDQYKDYSVTNIAHSETRSKNGFIHPGPYDDSGVYLCHYRILEVAQSRGAFDLRSYFNTPEPFIQLLAIEPKRGSFKTYCVTISLKAMDMSK